MNPKLLVFRHRTLRGFTIIELLVVIVVISILISIIIVDNNRSCMRVCCLWMVCDRIGHRSVKIDGRRHGW